MTEENSEKTIKEKARILSSKELLNSDIPEPEWLCEGLVPKKSIILYSGQKAGFKSYLNLYFGICLSAAITVFGEFKVPRKMTVLYIDEENGWPRIKDRIKKLYNGLGIAENAEGINFFIMSKRGVKLDEDDGIWIKYLDMIFGEIKPDLVIFDSVVRMMTGDENSVKDVRKIFENLSKLMVKHSCGFSLIHHSGKKGSSPRGSSDFEYMVDKTFLIERKGKTEFCLTQDKERDNYLLDDVNFEVHNTLDDKGIQIICMDITPHTATKKYELTAQEIRAWISTNKVRGFKTMEVRNAMDLQKDDRGNKKYTYGNVTEALNMLERTGFIKNVSKGMWEVLLS